MHNWFPENISTYGGELDSVFWLIFWLMLFWFVLTEGAILYSVVRYRRSNGARPAYLRGERWRELAWILVPGAVVLALDLGIDAAGARVWEEVKGAIPKGDVHLEVTGRQFEWSIRYPGPDAKLGTQDDFTVDNELHVPAGKEVRVTLKSQDVLHSFFLPHVRLKQDAVPGRAIDAWFEATKPGTYELACAELCGFGHYTMRGVLVVHTPEDFERWVAERTKG